jgi:hypothetical protein
MARTKKSSLAMALKQTRPFVSLEQEVYLSILRTASELSYAVDQFLSALRHHAITVQRLADTPGSWDGWTLPERNIGTDGDCDARHIAPAGSHGEGRMGYARTGGR